MKRLTLYFTTAPRQGFVSNIIRWVQKTPFSHVAIGLNIGSLDRNIVYEAIGKGVVCQEYSNWLEENKIIAEFAIEYDVEEYKRVQQKCIDQLGKPYGFRNLLAIALGRTQVIDDGKSFICSELAYMATKNQLPELYKNQDVVTPKDLYEALIKKYGGDRTK